MNAFLQVNHSHLYSSFFYLSPSHSLSLLVFIKFLVFVCSTVWYFKDFAARCSTTDIVTTRLLVNTPTPALRHSQTLKDSISTRPMRSHEIWKPGLINMRKAWAVVFSNNLAKTCSNVVHVHHDHQDGYDDDDGVHLLLPSSSFSYPESS